MRLAIIPFRTASVAYAALIAIGLGLLLQIVSFSTPWLRWGNDATPWAVRSYPPDSQWYQMDSTCTVTAKGQSVKYYSDAACGYWNGIRAMIMMAFLAAVACGIFLFFCLLVPKYTRNLKKGILVLVMLASWIFNIIGIAIFVGFAMKAGDDLLWASPLSSSSVNTKLPKQSFPWEAGFIVLIVVVIVQMVTIVILFPTMDALNQYRLPSEDQQQPMLSSQSQAYPSDGSYQPPQSQQSYPYPQQQLYGMPPSTGYSGVPQAAPAPVHAHSVSPPYPYPPHPAQAQPPAPAPTGWPNYPPHPQAAPPTAAAPAGWPFPSQPAQPAPTPTAAAPPTAWPSPYPPHGWPYAPQPNMTAPPPAAAAPGAWPYPPYLPYPYPYSHPYPPGYPTPATLNEANPTPPPVDKLAPGGVLLSPQSSVPVAQVSAPSADASEQPEELIPHDVNHHDQLSG